MTSGLYTGLVPDGRTALSGCSVCLENENTADCQSYRVRDFTSINLLSLILSYFFLHYLVIFFY